jgi:hypothetical protein
VLGREFKDMEASWLSKVFISDLQAKYAQLVNFSPEYFPHFWQPLLDELVNSKSLLKAEDLQFIP